MNKLARFTRQLSRAESEIEWSVVEILPGGKTRTIIIAGYLASCACSLFSRPSHAMANTDASTSTSPSVSTLVQHRSHSEDWILLSGGYWDPKTNSFEPHRARATTPSSEAPNTRSTLAHTSIYSFFCELEGQPPDIL